MKIIIKKLVLALFIFFLVIPVQLLAQFDNNTEAGSNFYLDVIVFKGKEPNMGRVDFYAAVPYEDLLFTYSNDVYAANYQITFELIDSTGSTVKVFHKEKIVEEDDFYITQGGTAEADFTQKVFFVPPGKYTARAILKDAMLNQEFSKSRTINVINFDEYPFSISGLLLLSSIEETGGKYSITPFIAENIASLPENFFAFFETYNNMELAEANFVYEIINKETDEVKIVGDIVTKDISGERSQEFIRIDRPDLLETGKYILRVIALRPGVIEYTEDDYLAVAQRTIQFVQTLRGLVHQDLDKAIEQLAYVATSKEISNIKNATTDEEKLALFEAFWQTKDPSPGTERNEAFIEYYNRIQKANQAFGTYSEGWMTDRGMVFIVFGPPYNIERGRSYSDGSTYERWVYMNNREFVFLDQSGFGDFRLIQPYAISEKYTYGR